MKRVTLKDVARAAGVSIGTASYALRGILLTRPETARKVQQTARELGYAPDPILSQAMAAIRHHAPREGAETLAYAVAYAKPGLKLVNGTWRAGPSAPGVAARA